MGNPFATTILIVAVILLILLVILSLRIAAQYERAVVFRLGRYNRTAGPGIYFLLPMIEWQVTQDLRTKTTSVEAQETIMQSPAGLELRRMQMITEVGAEQNSMTIVMMPSEFVSMAHGIGEVLRSRSVEATPAPRQT